MAQVEMDRGKFIPRCIKLEDNLLPLFYLMCSDCVTTDHVGHNLCKVSEVAEFHQKKLEKVLKSSLCVLARRDVSTITKETNQSYKDTESLISRIEFLKGRKKSSKE